MGWRGGKSREWKLRIFCSYNANRSTPYNIHITEKRTNPYDLNKIKYLRNSHAQGWSDQQYKSTPQYRPNEINHRFKF